MLRLLEERDLARLCEIEQIVQHSPWTEATFKQCLKSGAIGFVTEYNKQVTGFIILSLSLPEEGHILNFGVAAEHQNKGIGTRLLQHALSYAIKKSAQIVWLEVRRSNQKAISLYEKIGFSEVSLRKNYYPHQDGREDAIIYAISLNFLDSSSFATNLLK